MIISSILVKYFEFYIADPICSLIISVLIILSVIPLLKDSTDILLQRTPAEFLHNKTSFLEKINNIDGVDGVADIRVWTIKSEIYVGTCTVTIKANHNHQDVLNSARKVWMAFGVQYGSTQIRKKKSGET